MQPAKTHRIAVYPGDGIGVDVIDEAVRCLRALHDEALVRVDLTRFDWGLDYHRRTGKVCPDDFLATLKRFDAILFGALGDPRVLPDYLTLRPLIEMRQQLELYACLRPAKLVPGVRSPLRTDITEKGLDIMIVRENSEGEYAANGGGFKTGMPDEMALETSIHTRKGVERIIRFAFDLARKRRKRLTLATKSNAIKYAMPMWDNILLEIGKDYPDVQADRCHVDALAMNFVLCPQKYDVVVASNLFGDILSDLGGAISGSLGLAPSANINPERKFPSLFEPVHGSALDIAGKGIANPLGALRCVVMMLDFLGEAKAASVLERAINENLKEGPSTPDIGGRATTSQVGDDVVMRIRRITAADRDPTGPRARL
eukprot:TRINITY_DN18521_c0_g1_i1.p1 TRINITY_DN18521_c0_g1~~TRINITY_DN18521_c0_g1_i1.p1  ORF type:complete len:389 (+),score=112.30 TRINITY_DN18521_c0_g1_i1:53-1168(+)